MQALEQDLADNLFLFCILLISYVPFLFIGSHWGRDPKSCDNSRHEDRLQPAIGTEILLDWKCQGERALQPQKLREVIFSKL